MINIRKLETELWEAADYWFVLSYNQSFVINHQKVGVVAYDANLVFLHHQKSCKNN